VSALLDHVLIRVLTAHTDDTGAGPALAPADAVRAVAPVGPPSMGGSVPSVILWPGPGGSSSAPGTYVWCPACTQTGAPAPWFPKSKHGAVLLLEALDEHLTHRAPAPAGGGRRDG